MGELTQLIEPLVGGRRTGIAEGIVENDFVHVVRPKRFFILEPRRNGCTTVQAERGAHARTLEVVVVERQGFVVSRSHYIGFLCHRTLRAHEGGEQQDEPRPESLWEKCKVFHCVYILELIFIIYHFALTQAGDVKRAWARIPAAPAPL